VNTLLFLILFPFVAGVFHLFVPRGRYRRGFGYASALIILTLSVYLIFWNYNKPAVYYDVNTDLVNAVMLAIEALIAVFIIYQSLVHKKYYPLALVIVQSAILLYFEMSRTQETNIPASLFLDRLSLIMAGIIGIIGPLIYIYAYGYMKRFHEHHKEIKDRRNVFYFVIYAFLGAMFGLVFSNNLTWIFFFWELTTICSFILIGYTGSHEAANNAFKALWMNLLGGVAFAIAILYLGTMSQPALTLDEVLLMNKSIILLPAALIGFAALTKSAQMPFSSWLVGAMVAPTPVSALLHSSTMVKAGVYMLIRLAPIYEGTDTGALLSLIGGVTFLIASGIAVSQRNAKKVLAYSTIANLGLVVACAGVGTFEAVWAGILLIIFHALAKSLMFLSVGAVEQKIQSKDIEDMSGLIYRMPKVTAMMIIGIAGMFLAPFGMLISKWATLRAFIDSNPLLVGIVAYGSGMTVFFWSKWMGKMISATSIHKTIEEGIDADEMVTLYSLTVLTIAVCWLFPVISNHFIEPYVLEVYGRSTHLSQDNIMIMFLMLAVILMMPFSLLYFRKDRKRLSPYMSGRTTIAGAKFAGTAGAVKDLSLRNYYLENIFSEEKLLRIGVPICALLVLAMLVFSRLQYAGVLL